MGKLEQGPLANENLEPQEMYIPPEVVKEVAKMDQDLVSEAKVIFQDNHELVKEAMFGMGSRKAKEVLENLERCREEVKNAVKKFRAEKERIYS